MAPSERFVDEKHISNVMKNLYDQRKKSRFCDIVFKVCGEEIFAHSNVLAAASPYFASFLGMGQGLPRAFFQKAPQIIEIHIDGASKSNTAYGMAVRKVIDFMYTSVIELSFTVLSHVVEIAKIMQMDRVLEFCERFQQNVPTFVVVPVIDSKPNSEEDPQTIKKDPDYQLDNLITNNFVADEYLPPQEINDSKDQTTQTPIFTPTNPNVLSVSNNCLVLSSSTATSSASSIQPCETINGQPFQVSDCTAETIFEESSPIQDTDSLMDETLSTLVTHTTTSTNTTSVITAPTNVNSVSNSENQNLSLTIEGDKTENTEDSVETGKPAIEPETQIELEEKSLSQCPATVRSSLRIRLGKKHTRSRSIYRNRGKTRSRLHSSSNNNQNSANNNDCGSGDGGRGKRKKLAKANNMNFEVYVCNDCLYSTFSFYHFKRHQKIHLEGKYGCDKCDYKANKLKTLTDHNRSHLHAELQCSYCDYKATNAEELTLHLSRHSGEHPYFCCLCDMKFKTKTQLNLHAPKHSEDKPFVCPKCFAGFKWKHALKSHMVVHSNTKDHLCDVCGFATAHKSQLKAHHLIHTGETFKCTVQGCIFQALKRQNLKYHMLTHTHEKPHICRVCNQSFSLIKNMKRHMLLHSNDRPYKCDHCSFTSTRYDKLKEHLLKQHGIGERPNKKHRISDYQISNNNGLFAESYGEEAEESSAKEENTIPATTTQIVITASDDIPVPFAITRVNCDGFTEISYPTIQYV